MYLFQRSYNCTKSWIVVASISFMRSIILIASLFVSMLGVGIHGQSWYNWLFFVGVAHWCGLIHAFTKSLTFDVHSFCMALMWKRRSIERLVPLLDEQMPRKNLLAARAFDEQLEDGLSFVLFFKVACDLVGIIIYVWLKVGLPQFSSRVIFVHQIHSLCRTVFYTVSLLTFVACLQERVEDRWTASTECCDSSPAKC